MASIGDVFVRLSLDTSAFERGVTAAQQQTAKLGNQLDLFRTPAAAAAAATRTAGNEIVAAGESARAASGHFDVNNRVLARFASIGVQEVVPSLQGSRLALENLFQPILRLSGGFGGLALAAVGVAGAVGYGVYKAFTDTQVVWKDAQGNIAGVDEKLKLLNSTIKSHLAVLEFVKTAGAGVSDLGGDIGGLPGSGLSGSFFSDKLEKDLANLKGQERTAKLQQIFEASGFSEAGGLAAQVEKNGLAMAKSFLDLDKALKQFEASAGHLAVTDPLQKMLIADYQSTQDLINSYLKLIEVGDLAADKGAALIGRAGAAGGQRQLNIRNAFNTQQGGAAEQALGFGGTGILSGLDDIKKLSDATDIYRGNIKRMVDAGVSQRDIYNEIQKAQTNVDASLTDLNKKYADNPAVLDLINTKLGKLPFGQFARDLNETAAGLGLTNKASVTFIDTATDFGDVIEKTWTPALGKANAGVDDLNRSIGFDFPSAEAVASASVVSLTGNYLDLARALQYAALQQMLLNAEVGKAANLSAAPRATPVIGGE